MSEPIMSPWPHQIAARDAVFAEFDRGINSTLAVLPTGCGKSLIAGICIEEMSKRGGSTLFVAQRDVLIDQAVKLFSRMGLEVIVEKAAEKGYENFKIYDKPDVVVASMQTLREGRLSKWEKSSFKLIIIDECFIAGTKVDGKNIESIVVGDFVNSYNHYSKSIEKKRVLKTYKSKPNSLIRVSFFSGRTIICTEGHPFFNPSENRYVPALEIKRGQRVFILERSSDAKEKSGFSSLHCLWNNENLSGTNRAYAGQEGKSLLFGRLSEQACIGDQQKDDGRDKQETCICSDEIQQPNEENGKSRENDFYIASKKPYASNSRRQWEADCGTSENIGRETRLACRSYSENWDEEREWISKSLQDRYCQRSFNDSNRSRWEFSLSSISESSRYEEAEILRVDWVDRVEILQQESDGGFGKLCPGGYVYNLEVEGNNNYFAEGYLVHNCHHSLSKGHLRIFDYFSKSKLLGITATPVRGDEKNLGSLFQTKAYEYRIAQAIQDGYLVRPIRRLCPVTVDLRGIKTVGGDFSLGDLEEKISPKIEVLARAFADEIGQRKAVAFLPCVGSSMAFANCLELLGVTSRYVTCEQGEFGMLRDNKEKNLTDFEKDDYQVICCNRMLIEGWDHKKLEAVGIICPTKLWHVAAQMIGRALRICPEISKKNALVVDFDWQTDRNTHFLSTVVQLFNDGSLDDEILKIAEGIVKKKEAKNEAVDPMEIIEEAKETFHRKSRFLVQLTGKSEQYKVIESDPVGISSMLGVKLNSSYDILTDYVDPPTQKQINYLRTLGMSRPEMLSKWGASKMIDKLVRRRDKGLATPRQMKELIKTGLAPEHVREFTRSEASEVLTSKKTQKQLFE